MDKLLKEHFTEHPEEYVGIASIMTNSFRIKEDLKRRQKDKADLIAECKRRLYGKQA